MAPEPSPQELVDAVRGSFTDTSPSLRPVHAIGIAAKGVFEASDAAATYCSAEHFRGQKVDATVRFSNGNGSRIQRDGVSDVRGMATRFHFADGAATDLIAMTLGQFFTPDVKSFMDMLKAGKLVPVERSSPWRKIIDMLALRPPAPDPDLDERLSGADGLRRYADANEFARLGVFQAAMIGAPVSYVRATYHAVHTFVVTSSDGEKRNVRFAWKPVAGVRKIEFKRADPGRNVYLQQELRQRLAKSAARFQLMMSIGEAGDAYADSTRPWPNKRRRVTMGTLTLHEVPDDQGANCEQMGFNPCRLIPGIEVSDDPILKARKEVYKVSQKLRGAAVCPFAGE